MRKQTPPKPGADRDGGAPRAPRGPGGAPTGGAAFAELVATSCRRVRAVALRVMRNEADAEDVMQETYARVYEGLTGLRDPRALQGWIARIAHHAAVDRLRTLSRERAVLIGDDLDDVVDEAPSVHQRAASSEDRAHLERALASLPAGQRAVLVLHAEGLSAREIAAALGVAVGTVESRLHRGRRRARRALEALQW